ncbi:MAG TPA: magnesium transporter [Clostridiaceae bacterium]|nr:magnesium transporter [Clostridiaceae bacterium]
MEQAIFDELLEMLENRDYRNLKTKLAALHEADVAEFLEELNPYKAAIVFRLLPKPQAAEVFSMLDSDQRQSLVSGFSDQEVSDIIEELYTDDAVDFLEELPANAVNRVLSLATPDTRKILNHYMKYAEDSAGSIMTSEYVMLRPSYTVLEAIKFIRTHGADRETIYTCYITDPTRRLIGVVSVRQLLIAGDEQLVSEVMEENVIYVEVDTDQEEVANIFTDYDLISLPVVDKENRLVGIVTFDDVLDVVRKETTEDMELMAGLRPSERPYMKTSTWSLASHRMVWLLVLMVSGMLNGMILQHYEHAFLALPILVSFVPMLTDTGGNAGAQSSVIVIRSMVLDEIQFRDLPKVLWKEFRIGVIAGLVLSAVNFFRIYLTYGHNIILSLTVSFSLVLIVIFAKICGAIMPMMAKKIGLDPAIMASPMITTIVDALGLIIYFNLATKILIN